LCYGKKRLSLNGETPYVSNCTVNYFPGLRALGKNLMRQFVQHHYNKSASEDSRINDDADIPDLRDVQIYSCAKSLTTSNSF